MIRVRCRCSFDHLASYVKWTKVYKVQRQQEQRAHELLSCVYVFEFASLCFYRYAEVKVGRGIEHRRSSVAERYRLLIFNPYLRSRMHIWTPMKADAAVSSGTACWIEHTGPFVPLRIKLHRSPGYFGDPFVAHFGIYSPGNFALCFPS